MQRCICRLQGTAPWDSHAVLALASLRARDSTSFSSCTQVVFPITFMAQCYHKVMAQQLITPTPRIAGQGWETGELSLKSMSLLMQA
eukprot:1478430-Amphidinium_carterae.2